MRAGRGVGLVVVALGIALFLPGASSAQVSSPYRASSASAPYQPLPIPGGGEVEVLTSGLSNGTAGSTTGTNYTIDLPFPFYFFGTKFDKVTMGSHGALGLGPNNNPTIPSGSGSMVSIPNIGNPNNFIAAWRDGLICGEGNPGGEQGGSGHMSWQVLGAAPNRIAVFEWDRCRKYIQGGGTEPSDVQMQIWLYEAKDEIEVRYGNIRPGSFTAVMGVENANGTAGTNGIAFGGTACESGICRSYDFPSQSVLYYFWADPNPVVEAVEADRVGRPGQPYKIRTTVRNRGAGLASQFDIQYHINTEPRMTDDAIPIGGSSGHSVTGGNDLIIEDEPILPLDLVEPDPSDPSKPVIRKWYVIARVAPSDPRFPSSERREGVGPYVDVFGEVQPFEVPEPAPDPAVGNVVVPERIRIGEPFVVRWEAKNVGDLPIDKVPYRIVLTRAPAVTRASRRLSQGSEGHIDLGKFESREVVVNARITDEDIESGTYYIGVELDPNGTAYAVVNGTQIPEYTRTNNTGVSGRIVIVNDNSLKIQNDTLPAANLGAAWSVRLHALGGDGVHRWSTKSGTALPPGLRLEEEPPGARALGQPYATFLRGTPAAVGTFPFTLRVTSGNLSDEKDFVLSVHRGDPPLGIITANLPFAAFGDSYEATLMGGGGKPPYTWSIQRGRLPMGLSLRSDGVLVGKPVEDGSFDVTFRVTDAEGETSSRDLTINVSSPASMTCVTSELPTLPVGVEMEPFPLAAAGGVRPYTWQTDSTQVFPGGYDQKGDYLPNGVAPPGLILNDNGTVSGRPQMVGDYLWSVFVREADNPTPHRCTILVRVQADQGLSVTGQSLPIAYVGERYQGRLEASGGVGRLTWSLIGSSPIIGGSGDGTKALELKSGGEIEGIIRQEDLGEESEKVFSFLVRVTDEQNRQGVGSVSVFVRQERPSSGSSDEGGCGSQVGSGSTGAALLAALAALGLMGRRRED